MSWQHVTKNQIRQNLCDLLRQQILLQRQRFFYQNSRVHVHEAICCWDVSQQCVAATSCPTCTHGTICRHYLLLQVVTWPAQTEWSVAETCCCNLLPDLHRWSDLLPRLVAATCHPTCTHRVFCCRDLLLQLVTSCVLTFTGQNYVQVKIL